MTLAAAITVASSVLIFGGGVFFNGIRDRRQRESTTMERAAAAVVSASSTVLSALKALERQEDHSEPVLDRLDYAIDRLASSHASLVLAFGHPGPYGRPASTAAEWSRGLSRGAGAIADRLHDEPANLAALLTNPLDDARIAERLGGLGLQKVLVKTDAAGLISAVRERFVEVARQAIADGRSGQRLAGAKKPPPTSRA